MLAKGLRESDPALLLSVSAPSSEVRSRQPLPMAAAESVQGALCRFSFM